MGSDRSDVDPGEELRWSPTESVAEQQRRYLEGHRRNPLTGTVLGGRILSASQLPWFLLFPPRGFGVLATIGRRTGKSRRRCVRAIRRDDLIYVVSLRGVHAGWMHNIASDARVALRLKDGTFAGEARPVEQGERQRAREVYCDTVNPFDRLEYVMHRSGVPTADRIRDLHHHWFSVGTPVVIDLRRR